MASSTKQFSLFLLLLITLLSSLHIHARDSQFFSKVTNTNTNNPKENEIPTNKDEIPLKNEQKEQEEPNFIPQGQDGGYGLYGHESGQLPPATTTTTTVPATTTTTGVEPYSNSNNNEAYVTGPQGMSDTRFMEKGYTTPINSYNGGNKYNPEKQGKGTTGGEANNYFNGESGMYNPEKQGMSDTRFMEKGYTTPINSYEYNPEKQGKGTTGGEAYNYYNGESNMYNPEKQGMSDTRFMEKRYTTPTNTYEYNNGANMYNPEKQGMGTTGGEANNYYNGENIMYNPEKQGMSDTRFMEKGYTTPINSYNNNNGGSMYNPEKQGMSDTRFLEKGKYYYDPNSENYNSLNANDNSRGVDSRYEYNSKGNYGSNANSYDLNNNNANSMEFQNEEDLP